MQFTVRVAGRMSGDAVAQHTAEALGIFNSTPQFLSNERWEIEVVLPDEAEDAEEGPDGEIASAWELYCDTGDDPDEQAAREDLRRVRKALLEGGASDVEIEEFES
ncbi:hypothetical protein [Actinomadura alba]|uniref:Uncharacterized protein n=1 Tax=Actinomadura alba TaxID=406431 RepID=A0ABR7LJK5_9ACTN|nr:hypothetical protein [Actinomadura alba]MBC6465032.1 hypothetical protein [Actinomadura alba]